MPLIKCDCCKARVAKYNYTRMKVCSQCQQHLDRRVLGNENYPFEIQLNLSDGLFELEDDDLRYFTKCNCCGVYYRNGSPELITVHYQSLQAITYDCHCAVHHRLCPDGYEITQESIRELVGKLKKL